MESGTQVQLQTDGPEIIITSVGSANMKRQTTSTAQKVIRTNIPRVVIVAAPSQLSNTTNTASVKQVATVGHHAGGQTLQHPVPSKPIVIHPPHIAKMAVVSSSSSHHHQGQGQQSVTVGATSNGDANQGRQQQVMIIQQPTSVSNQQQSGNNDQSIIVTVANSDGRQETQTIYPIQGTTTYVYQDDGASYSPQVNYYQSNSSVGYQQPEELTHSPSSGYIVQQQSNNQNINIPEDETSQLSHTTRASPTTIHWLLQNYETAEGVSLPRCTLYSHYLKHCKEHQLDPVNAASFGKLIRSVFLGLRTRRLGTRGNSKYHYYGIRIKPESPLNKMTEDSSSGAVRQQPTNASSKRVTKPAVPNNTTPTQGHSTSSHAQPCSTSASNVNNNAPCLTASSDEFKHLLGPGAVPNIMPPSLSGLEQDLQRIGLSVGQAEKFFEGYRQHCEDLLDCVKNLLFNDVETCWTQFWQPDENNPADDDLSSDDSNLTGLSQSQLYTICTLQVVQEFIQSMDFQFYQVIVDILVPSVLKPIPSNLTQSIRNFAKHLESGLAVALQGAPEVIVKLKLDAVTSLAQTLRRYTSLNHLAQAARAVLQNPTQIAQMLTDLNRVDFRNVQEQASWVCYCNPAHVEEIEKNFKTTLEKQNTLEEWAEWLYSVVDQVLAEYCNRPLNELIVSAKDFLLKWSFYSSMVMRDLTLRSAPSFGSFHLIRLLYDEYMFYLIEQRVARATGATTVAVMSQSCRHHIHISNMDSYTHTHYNHHHSSTLGENENELNFNDHSYQMDDSDLASGIRLLATSHSAGASATMHMMVDQSVDSVVVSDDSYINDQTDTPDEYFIPASHHQQEETPAVIVERTSSEPQTSCLPDEHSVVDGNNATKPESTGLETPQNFSVVVIENDNNSPGKDFKRIKLS